MADGFVRVEFGPLGPQGPRPAVNGTRPAALRTRLNLAQADRLLIETDSPFLAPVPHRGRPCEPAYVRDTAAFVANLRGVSPEEIAETTARNFFALFTKATA